MASLSSPIYPYSSSDNTLRKWHSFLTSKLAFSNFSMASWVNSDNTSYNAGLMLSYIFNRNTVFYQCHCHPNRIVQWNLPTLLQFRIVVSVQCYYVEWPTYWDISIIVLMDPHNNPPWFTLTIRFYLRILPMMAMISDSYNSSS